MIGTSVMTELLLDFLKKNAAIGMMRISEFRQMIGKTLGSHFV